MKKNMVLFLVLLLVFSYLGTLMYQDSGYVLITIQNWSFETTLSVLIAGMFLVFVVLVIFAKILKLIVVAPGFIKNWFKNRKVKKAGKQTKVGLHAWVEGKWSLAEHLLISAAKWSDITLVNYLVAALIAQQQKRFVDRDNYLDRAHKLEVSRNIAVDLMRSQFWIEDKQFDKAAVVLNAIHERFPNNLWCLDLLYKAYLKLEDWKKLQTLFPKLVKYELLPKAELFDLEKTIYVRSLSQLSSCTEIQNLWTKIPRHLKRDDMVLVAYANSLIKSGEQSGLVEKLLRYTLKKSWNDLLIEKYGLVICDQPIKQLAFAERFLNDHRDSADLLICLGRLCKELQLWGKAQNYFEIALRLRESPILLKELGQLMELLNRRELALEYYRRSVEALDLTIWHQ